MKSFKISNYKSISMTDELYDDFMIWLVRECDGAKPTEALLNEFIHLEKTYGPALRKTVMREMSKNEKRNLSRKG